jgi:alkylhydroperoxidase family enzyme
MSRIRGLETHEAPFIVRPLYWVTRRIFGKDLTPLKVAARRPKVAWFGNLLALAFEKSSKIDARLNHLVNLRAAQMIGCPF